LSTENPRWRNVEEGSTDYPTSPVCSLVNGDIHPDLKGQQTVSTLAFYDTARGEYQIRDGQGYALLSRSDPRFRQIHLHSGRSVQDQETGYWKNHRYSVVVRNCTTGLERHREEHRMGTSSICNLLDGGRMFVLHNPPPAGQEAEHIELIDVEQWLEAEAYRPSRWPWRKADLLALILFAHGNCSTTQLAKCTGYNVSAVHSSLACLEQLGAVKRDRNNVVVLDYNHLRDAALHKSKNNGFYHAPRWVEALLDNSDLMAREAYAVFPGPPPTRTRQ
jgi:hypothetical protein